jgi:hypothetical protein
MKTVFLFSQTLCCILGTQGSFDSSCQIAEKGAQ